MRGGVLASVNLADEPPLRAELLSAEQMKQHGRTLAAAHKLALRWAPDRLLSRLADNEQILIEACRLLTEALAGDRRIVPAGEWLLDNFYLVEEQIRTARRHLPKGYSRELPRLGDGPSAGLPRVYDIALEAISHGDGRVDPESLDGFVAAYQSVTALKLGELWAVPIMLRLALIENLRRVSARVAAARIERDSAASWAEQMAVVALEDPKNLILVTADMARTNPPMASSFVAELAHRLQGLSLTLPLTWIAQRLSESNLTIEQMVHMENQQQAADQVSISNSIGSLRILGSTDWRKFVENLSAVEQTLREDPADAYRGMEFATRDRYRRTVETIARHSALTESEVARQAILLAQASATSGAVDERTRHVGFYLIDQGLPQLERAAHMRSSTTGALRAPGGRFPFFIYGAGIVLPAAIATGVLMARARADGGPGWLLALTGILSLVCTSQLAVALVDWTATLLATPHRLPRLDYSDGIPPDSRTLVVIPTMLGSATAIAELLEGLEVRYLANQDGNLHFALLTDLLDAPMENLPDDEALVLLAKGGIDALNGKYGGPGGRSGGPFLLFHRPRRFNPRERIWMGYERKRGKLAALNAFLRRGNEQGDFALVVGNPAQLSQVKYVITLDTDTQLPRDAARELVGAIAHPLNRATFDERTQCVRAGYGILQPRMAESLSGVRSRYAQLWSSEPGFDPYTRAVSDVYQDLFQEGSFIGKGIYEVDAFERALAGRFPENRILSHDLVEGCYARSGLLTDVQLYEEYPARYATDVIRRQRWIRGDWQNRLLDLAVGSCPGRGLAKEPALPARTLEDSRQSPAQLGADGRDSMVAARLVVASPPRVLDAVGPRRLPLSAHGRIPGGRRPEAEGCAACTAPDWGGSLGRCAFRTGVFRIGLPTVRGVVQRRCNPTHHLPNLAQPPPALGMESRKRRKTSARFQSRIVLSYHVDRAGCVRGDVAPSRSRSARSPGHRGPHPGPLVRRSGPRLVAQQAPLASRFQVDGGR